MKYEIVEAGGKYLVRAVGERWRSRDKKFIPEYAYYEPKVFFNTIVDTKREWHDEAIAYKYCALSRKKADKLLEILVQQDKEFLEKKAADTKTRNDMANLSVVKTYDSAESQVETEREGVTNQ